MDKTCPKCLVACVVTVNTDPLFFSAIGFTACDVCEAVWRWTIWDAFPEQILKQARS